VIFTLKNQIVHQLRKNVHLHAISDDVYLHNRYSEIYNFERKILNFYGITLRLTHIRIVIFTDHLFAI